MAQSYPKLDGETLKSLDDKYLLGVYNKAKTHFVSGKGCRLFDEVGKSYLDFGSGIAVSALGHGNPLVQEVVTQQAERYLHLSNLYLNDSQIELAQLLVENTTFDKAFFCNSGTEAIEACLKFARKYWYKQGLEEKFEIISFRNGFHGRTYGALSVTAQPKFQVGFGEMVPGSVYLDWNDVGALLAAVNENTAAILLEPMQAEGGLNRPTPEFIEAIMNLRREGKVLVIGDEVQCCLGRLGTFLGGEIFGLEYDLATLAKPLGGGLPLGAVLLRQAQADALSPGDHGTTFGGNPLSCALGVAVVKEVIKEGFLAELKVKSEALKKGLLCLIEEHSSLLSLKGEGLLLGLQTTLSLVDFIDLARAKGLLVLRAGTDVIRLAPPLVLSLDEIQEALNILKETLQELEEK